jgi:hypothetical protein
MIARVSLYLIVAVVPLWSQVEPSATGGGGGTSMLTPPPISGQPYATAVGNERRSNYLSGGIVLNTSYIDNFFPGIGTTPVNEMTYSILPKIELDHSMERQRISLDCMPGFTFYSPSSSFNQADQSATASYQFRLTPHSAISARDSFQYSSTIFGVGDSGAIGTVSGTLPSFTPGVSLPFAQKLTNSVNADYTLQTGRDSMIGVSGSSTIQHYQNPAAVTGLFDWSSRSGSGFYNFRISGTHYLGVSYQFSKDRAYSEGVNSDTTINTILAFYTYNPKPALSLSILTGAQSYEVSLASLPKYSSWEPPISVSLGWQGDRTSFSVNYSRSVTGGGGLLGASHSQGSNAAARWQISRKWTTGAGGGYALNNQLTPTSSAGLQNGHSISGNATLEHALTSRLGMSFLFDHVHQSYSGVPALSISPDSSRVTMSISWLFMRPIGR